MNDTRETFRDGVTAGTNPVLALSLLAFADVDDAELARRVRELTSPDCVFRLSGKQADVDGYLRHLAGLRAGVVRGELTIFDDFVGPHGAGMRAAFRCHARMTMQDGSTAEGESHVIGAFDGQSRVTALYDVGRFLEPGDDRPTGTPEPR